jgi:hypothetical protein
MRFLILLLMVSCSFNRYINTHDITRNLNAYKNSIKKVKKNLNKNESYFDGLLTILKEEGNVKEYRSLISIVKEYKAVSKKLINKTKSLLKLIKKFPHKKAGKIIEKDPRYAKVERSFHRINFENEDFQNKYKGYIALINKIKINLKKKKIYRVEAKQLKKLINRTKKISNGQIGKIKDQIQKAQNDPNSSKYKSKLVAIEGKVDEIELTKNQLIDYLDQLNNKILESEKLWLTPGRLGHDYAIKIEKILKRLQRQANEYNTLASKLKT